MSDSVRPHPWDSPGKNTGVDCHFLLQCIKVKSESEVAQSCPTLRDPMDCSLPDSSVHGIFQARVLDWGAKISLGIRKSPPLEPPPTSLPTHPFRLLQSPCLSSLSHTANSHWLSSLHMVM